MSLPPDYDGRVEDFSELFMTYIPKYGLGMTLIFHTLTLALPWGQYDSRGMFGVTPRLKFAADFCDTL